MNEDPIATSKGSSKNIKGVEQQPKRSDVSMQRGPNKPQKKNVNLQAII